MTRWLVLAGHVSPYMAELWSGIARVGGDEVTLVHTRGHGGSAYAHERIAVVGGTRSIQTHPWDPRRALGALRAWNPDILLCLGHATPYALQVAAYDAIRSPGRIRAYCGDTNGIQLLRTLSSSGSRRAMHAAKRALVSGLFSEALSLGWTNELALEALGLKRVTFAPVYCVDFSDAGRESPDPVDVARWAEMKGPRYLAVARCVPAKNLLALMAAWRTRLQEGASGSLTFVGDGPGLADLRRAAGSSPTTRVWVAGARDSAVTRSLIQCADYLVLPSVLEPWGIVVVEALGGGIPCICSERVGSAVSLGRIAGDAILFTTPDEGSLGNALRTAEVTLESRRRMAARVAPSIRDLYGMEAGVSRLVAWGSSMVCNGDTRSRGQVAGCG